MWAFPRGEIILGVLEMPGTPQNESGQLITKLAQKLARIVKRQMKPTHFPPIPTMANGSFLEGNESNMEEIRGTQSWENLQERARLSAILWGLRGEIILGVLEMPDTPKKRKWTANHQISPETGKN